MLPDRDWSRGAQILFPSVVLCDSIGVATPPTKWVQSDPDFGIVGEDEGRWALLRTVFASRGEVLASHPGRPNSRVSSRPASWLARGVSVWPGPLVAWLACSVW